MFGKKKRTQVIVVGAGPVGRLLALALNTRGVDVHLFDQEWRGITRSYATALHPSALELLDQFGIAQPVLDQALPVERVVFYDSEGPRAAVDLKQLPSRYPLVAVIPQSAFEEILEHELHRRGITIEWQRRVAVLESHADRMDVSVEVMEHFSTGYATAHTEVAVQNTLHYEAAFVIGADGGESFTRLNQGFEIEQLGGPEHFRVFEFLSDRASDSEVRIVLDNSHSNVLWTLPGGHQRWSFQVDGSAPDAEKSRLLSPLREPRERTNVDALNRLIQGRAPWFGWVDNVVWAGDARFERRLAPRLGKGRVWLLGDAAHQTGPIGVQSMNAGLIEADELASVLSDIVIWHGPLDGLASYEATVQRRWRRLLGKEDAICAQDDAEDWVRAHASSILSCIPASDGHLLAAADQLRLTLVSAWHDGRGAVSSPQSPQEVNV
jgi:2-polyprenyl-6-methoxyphenol hydroxylase-like FAD-dependent oxidoreductase